MAITAYGVDQSITEPKWARLMQVLGRGAWQEIVAPSGSQFAPSVGTGTRLIQVAAGDAVVAGVLVESTASTSVVLDANNGSNPRIDTVVLQVDWSGTATVGGASIIAVKGVNAAAPVPPSLTANRAAGTLWQMPIAQVTVQAGVGQIAAADLQDVRPGPRASAVYKDPIAIVDRPFDAASINVARVDVPDPGWPYRLDCYAKVNFASMPQGIGVVGITVDGTEIASGRTEQGCQPPAHCRDVTQTRNGVATVRVTVQPSAMNSPNRLQTVATHSNFVVVVLPA